MFIVTWSIPPNSRYDQGPSSMENFTVDAEKISEFGLTYGLVFFIGFMLFIIWDVAKESKAGRFGTFILFFVLAFGIFGFIMKNVIQWILGI